MKILNKIFMINKKIVTSASRIKFKHLILVYLNLLQRIKSVKIYKNIY